MQLFQVLLVVWNINENWYTGLVFLLGDEAIRMVVAEGRRVAEGLTGPRKANLQHLCNETEMLTNKLSDYCRKGMVSYICLLSC